MKTGNDNISQMAQTYDDDNNSNSNDNDNDSALRVEKGPQPRLDCVMCLALKVFPH